MKKDILSIIGRDFFRYATILNGIGNGMRRLVLEKFTSAIPDGKWSSIDLSNFNAYKFSDRSMGNILAPGSVVSTKTTLGRFCIVNYNATVGHDCELGDYVTVSPNTSIGGWCKLGDECYIGAGANVLPKVKIGKRAIIGAGAVVTKDVPEGVIAKGIPAKWS
jgi:sugar O-acyltransferase (sialic acid O-acetyltransferase NeuD family)